MRDDLRFVNRQQAFDRFELKRDVVLDDQIEAITTIKMNSLIIDRKRSLALELEPSLAQLGAYTSFVCSSDHSSASGGLQQPWTKVPMHFDEHPDDLVRDAEEWLKNHPILKSSDLPNFLCKHPLSPDKLAHCYAERFALSAERECLSKIVPLGERLLRKTVSEYVSHYHGERNHQGLDNRLLEPMPARARNAEPIKCRKRLGGVLNSYYRNAA